MNLEEEETLDEAEMSGAAERAAIELLCIRNLRDWVVGWVCRVSVLMRCLSWQAYFS